MEIKKVGVLGAGLMGHGIAQVAAQSGYDVVVREVDQATLDKGLGKIEKQLARAVEKGKIEQSDADAVRGRIKGTLHYGDFAECDLILEAITEDLGMKLEMWRELNEVMKADAICATNTSSLPVIDQAAVTERPERFFGLHFFNPAQVMKLVEVIRCVTTSDETFEAGRQFTESIGKLGIPHQGQGRLHRQPPAGALHARRDPRLRGGRRLDRGDRRGDEGGRRPPDGAAHAGRLRRASTRWARSAT